MSYMLIDLERRKCALMIFESTNTFIYEHIFTDPLSLILNRYSLV